jgi:hypothetical protein
MSFLIYSSLGTKMRCEFFRGSIYSFEPKCSPMHMIQLKDQKTQQKKVIFRDNIERMMTDRRNTLILWSLHLGIPEELGLML